MREWREKSDWNKDITECYLIIYPHKMEENLFELETEKKLREIPIVGGHLLPAEDLHRHFP